MRNVVLYAVAALVLAGAGFWVSSHEAGETWELKNLFEEEPKEYTLLFVGDIMLDRGVDYMAREHGDGDPRYPFELISDVTREADLAIGNLEGPISDKGADVGSIYSFRMDPRYVEGLTFAGFDVLSLANNHIWDYGRGALVDTVERLRAAGIGTAGAGRNYGEANAPYVAALPDGTTVAFLSYTNLYPPSLRAGIGSQEAGISDPNLESIKPAIQDLRSENDVVVVLWHWGDEYQPRSSPREREIAHELIDAGADLIVGHHPHVAQEIEEYPPPNKAAEDKPNKYIAYSLGNFIFDQFFSEETMRGYMLRVTVREGKIISAVPFPVRLSDTFQPYLGWRRTQFLENLPFKKLTSPVGLAEGFSAYEGVLGDTPGAVHRGIDYARRDGIEFLPFDVFAMHAGTAMQGESETWGSFVIARYAASPTLSYYTIYAHLSDIPAHFPRLRTQEQGRWRGVPIGAGEFVGQAGTSGNAKGVTQLHVELHEQDLAVTSGGAGRWLKLDPYSIYGRTGDYPQPGEPLGRLEHYWVVDEAPFAE